MILKIIKITSIWVIAIFLAICIFTWNPLLLAAATAAFLIGFSIWYVVRFLLIATRDIWRGKDKP